MNLTGIRQQVFLDRYALKDEAGKPIEQTPEEMWRRVAHAIAAVEPKSKQQHWEDQFYGAMQNFVLVPGGRILSGAGTGYKVTFYNCLPPDQEVLTPNGYKPIKDVMEGDMVITGKKRARRVNRVFVRKTEEPLFVIKTTKLGFDDVRVTGEHPVLAIKQEWVNRHRSRDGLHLKNPPQWIKALELAKGDFVAVAWNEKICVLTKLHLRDYLPETFVPDGAFVTKRYLKKPVKEEVDIDEAFMLLAGTWLGDGCVTHRTGTDIPAGIQITFNKDQKKWAEEIAYILQEKFVVVPTVREDEWGQRLIQVRVESYPVGLFFKNFFGAYSHKKKIPQVLMEQPKEHILPLIKGMFRSDGYLSKSNLGIALSNKELAVQLHQLLLRTGRFFTIFQNNAKGGRHDTYRVTAGVSQANGLCEYIFGEKKTNTHHDQDYFLTHDDLFWVRIESIDTVSYKGRVYDLEVEEDHSFITGGIVVSNCFVIPSPHDSRGGILKTLTQMVEIMSRGGGVGINLSSLRPRGARVKKVNGFSSGPCNWAELFSVATKDIIQQGGSRRGALMIMLWDWHPDIEEFTTVKQDLTRINGANLSVCVSDAFMDAVKNDHDWELVFPDTADPEYDEKWDGYLPNWKALGKKVIVNKTIKARALWDLIAQAAWRSAEPGVVFMERYNKWFNNSYWEYVNCVNPCVTGDTLVATQSGEKAARDLIIGDNILTPKGFKPIDKVYNNGKQRIYQVNFSDGGHLRATADHQLRVVRQTGGEVWVKAIDLTQGDMVRKLIFLGAADHRGQSNQSDGNKHKENNNHEEILGIEGSDIHDYKRAFLANTKLNNQQMALTMAQTSIAGTVSVSIPVSAGGNTVSANTTWPISAEISESFLSSQRVSNGDFIHQIKTSTPMVEELNIDGKRIGTGTTHVTSVTDTGVFEDVYDVHEPETLTWVTNGYVSFDCGEEGLPNWGVCNLTSINLAALVNDNGEMDYDRLAEVAKIGVRFQDDVIDADFYVFDEIKKRQKEGERRIGLGTVGLGDALIKMKLRYGSKESLPVVDKIYKTIRDAAYEASAGLARERGPFPGIDKKKHLDGYFIKQLPESIRAKMKKWGVRNSVILQQAPTGTTSLLSGVSSGIEPVYEFEMIRRDRMGEHTLRHPLYETWYEQFKTKNGREPTKEDRPDHFVSANDLTPEDHVYVQATIQKYVDASISKTVNAPNAHTVEDVKRLYTLAYELGCKGITYMREGSRPGVLSRLEEAKEIKSREAGSGSAGQNGETAVKIEGQYVPEVKPRPMVVQGSTYQVETPVGQAYVTINTNGGKQPVELFVNVGKAGSDVTAMAEAMGRLISLLLRIASPIAPLERAHKIASELIGIGGARSLGFGENRVRSLPDAVAKVIDRHFGFFGKSRAEANGERDSLANGPVQPPELEPAEKPLTTPPQQMVLTEKRVVSVDLCPSCGAGSLVFEEACKKCYSCGYSEC